MSELEKDYWLYMVLACIPFIIARDRYWIWACIVIYTIYKVIRLRMYISEQEKNDWRNRKWDIK